MSAELAPRARYGLAGGATSGSGLGGTGVETTKLLTVCPCSRNWSSTSPSASTALTWIFIRKQSSPEMRWHSATCGVAAARAVIFGSCRGSGRTRTQAVTGSPRAAGSTSNRYPQMTPVSSNRATLALTAGADISTRRASSAVLSRGSSASSRSRARLIESSEGLAFTPGSTGFNLTFAVITPTIPLICYVTSALFLRRWCHGSGHASTCFLALSAPQQPMRCRHSALTQVLPTDVPASLDWADVPNIEWEGGTVLMLPSEAGRGGKIDRLTLAGVFVSTLAFSTAYGILLVLPLYITLELDGTEADYGLVTSSATVTAILCLGLLIRFPSRVPPNYLLAVAAAVYALGALGVAQLDSFGVPMVAFGLLLGTSWAIGYTTAPMVVSALSDDMSRGKYIGYVTGMIQVGFGLGPVLVSVAREAGLSFPDCFRVAGVLAALAAVVAAVLHLRSSELATVRVRDQWAAAGHSFVGVLGRVLRSPVIIPLGIVFLCACLFTTMNSFQTTFAESRGLAYSVFYISYTLAVIVARFIIAPWLRNAASPGVVAAATVGLAISMLTFLVVGHNATYAVAAVLLGITYGLTLPGVQAGAVNLSDESARARILPLAGLIFQTGILLFPLLAGTVIANAGYTAMLSLLVCFAAAIAVFGCSQWIIGSRSSAGATHQTGRRTRA